MTLDRFLALPDRPGKQEFDRGRVIEMPPQKYVHSLTAKKNLRPFSLVLQGRGLTVFSETGFLLAPDVVRQPDVAVVEEASLKDAKADDYLAGAPLLAIEVASPANTAEKLDIKIDQYLRTGSQAVWVAYPKRKAIVRSTLIGGKIHAAEHKAGATFSEDIVSPRCEFDPAEFF